MSGKRGRGSGSLLRDDISTLHLEVCLLGGASQMRRGCIAARILDSLRISVLSPGYLWSVQVDESVRFIKLLLDGLIEDLEEGVSLNEDAQLLVQTVKGRCVIVWECRGVTRTVSCTDKVSSLLTFESWLTC